MSLTRLRRSGLYRIIGLALIASAGFAYGINAWPRPESSPGSSPVAGSTPTPTVAPTPAPSVSPTPRPTSRPTPSPVPSPPPAPTPSPVPTVSGFDPARVQLALVPVASGLQAPLYLTYAGDGSGLLYVVEQAGRIRLIGPGGPVSAPFLDIGARVSSGGEQGLLSVAFHPQYAANGRLFVDYTDLAGNTVVSEFQRLDATHADPASERIILHIAQPYANHNGGLVKFGPDGYLYIGMGDGGSGGDPLNNGQRTDTLLGKMLRIDVNGAQPYAVPPSDPFVSRSGVLPEIWALGLRNPWRYSFDRQTGALFIGDVGQSSWEEIDAAARGVGGQNYGWRIMEGAHCYGAASCNQQGLTLPVAEYGHGSGDCSVTGGYVYRGASYPVLQGGYLFGDYCSGRMWALNAAAALRGPVAAGLLLDTGLNIASFGEDASGELYVVHLGGSVYRVTASPR